MKEIHRVRYGRGVHRASMPSLAVSPSWHLEVFTNPEASSTSFFKSFYRAHSQLRLPSPEFGGWCWKFPSSNHLHFLATSPILRLSRDPILSPLIGVNSGMMIKSSLSIIRHPCHSGNSQGSRSFVSATRDKSQIYFLFFHNMAICFSSP